MRSIIMTGLLMLSVALQAQTTIEKYQAGGQPQGPFYYLPKTAMKISVLVEKTTYTPGKLSKYADKYLRLKDVKQEQDVSHKILSISITPYAVADTSKCYVVKYSGKSIGTNMQLSPDGCLLAINTETTIPEEHKEFQASPKPKQIDPYIYLSEDILAAGSTTKMAQLTAQDIYEIRDSKNQLTRGQAEFMPKDGEQLKLMLSQLTTQDEAMTSLFAGTISNDTTEYILDICPTTEINKQILFRLSQQLGIVDQDDLSGTPYYIYIKSLNTIQKPATDPKKKKTKEEGIYVNVPEKVRLSITNGYKEIFAAELYAAQFGYTELISGDLFKRNTTKLTLFPTTGSIQKLEAEQPK